MPAKKGGLGQQVERDGPAGDLGVAVAPRVVLPNVPVPVGDVRSRKRPDEDLRPVHRPEARSTARERRGPSTRLPLLVISQSLREESQVVPGEHPLEGCSGLLVATLEGDEAVRDLGKVLEVVRGEDLALDDAEEDLDLVQPRSVNGQLDEGRVRPSVGEASAGRLAPVAAAVVDHPEHPPGALVGLCRHHLGDEAAEGHDARLLLATPQDLGPVHVPGGQVLERAPRSYSNSTRMSRPGAGARLGWRRARAWVEVFSSEETT